MVEAVARHGYAGTTLRELVRLAGVSKTTFYEHFDSKQECFLATFDEIVSQVTARVSAAYRKRATSATRLVAALTCFMELTVNEPEAAMLTAVESLTLGEAGVAHRERGSAAFELMIGQSFEHSPSKIEVSAATIRAIAAGIRGVVYRRLRAGKIEELPDVVDELVDWALEYRQPDGEAVTAGGGGRGRAATPPSGGGARSRLAGAARQPAQPRRADPARADRPRRRPAGRRERLRDAQHPGDLGEGRHLEPDFLRTLQQQTRGLHRRLRGQRLGGADRHRRRLRGRRRQLRGPRLGDPGDPRARLRRRALRAAHLLRPADGGAGRARPRRRGDGQLHRLPASEHRPRRGSTSRRPKRFCRRSAAGSGR